MLANDLIELSRVHPGFLQLLEGAAGLFGSDAPNVPPPVDLKALHAKIGELALENDFLEGALIKAGMLSVKR